MNKHLRIAVALLLAVAMAFTMTACGKKTEDTQTQTGSPASTAKPESAAASEYVYSAEYTTINNDNSWVGARLFAPDGFYFSAQEVVGQNIPEGVTPQWENEYAIYELRLKFVDFSGNIRTLEDYKHIEKETEHQYESYISSMEYTAEGDLMVFETLNEYWSDAPDGTPRDSDEYWLNYKSVSEHYVRVLDSKTGAEKQAARLNIPEEIASPTDGSYFWPYGLAPDNNGGYVMACEQLILGFDSAGNLTDQFRINNWVEGIMRLNDGRVGVALWDDRGAVSTSVVDFSVKKDGFVETFELPANGYNMVPGGGEYDFYYNNGTNLTGYNSKTGAANPIFSWINCDINVDCLSGFGVLDDGTVIGVVNNWDNNYENCTSEIVKVSLVPADSVPHKDIITLATQGISYYLRDEIIKFNRANANYRIEVKDYSEYNTPEDYSAGLTKLNTEILAGNVPDIIDLNALPYSRYAAKGILEDLYPYIDKDKELDRKDFFTNVLEALEVDGKLCTTCSNFSIYSFMAASSLVGDTPGWNYDQLNAALAEMPEDCSIFDYYYTRYDVLDWGLNLDSSTYIDWETGKCDFDSEQFKSLLKFANQFPEEFNWDNYDWAPEDEGITAVGQGRQLLTEVSLFNLDNVTMYDAIFGEEGGTFIGFPTENGTGNMIVMSSGYAMSTSCANKDGAWEFLRTFFTQRYQESTSYGVPTNIKAYDTMEQKAMEPSYKMTTDTDANGVVTQKYELDEDGNRIPAPKGTYYLANGDTIEYFELTEAHAAKVRELISTTTKFNNNDSDVNGIVKEQVEAYFQGQKSVDEVARIIQSKMNIYVNEQR